MDNIIKVCKSCSEKKKVETQKNIESIISLCTEALKNNEEVFFKTAFSEGEQTEHMWIKVQRLDTNTFTGTLDNDPVVIKNHHYKDKVILSYSEVEDYC